MRIAYFDCFSGASGDMILGAFVDAGLSFRRLKEELRKLKIPPIRLEAKKVIKGGIGATQVIVQGKSEKPHRSLREILEIIDRSPIEAEVKEKSREVFQRIASVEAEIHRKPAEEIHFHEIGGLDSVVDIVGSVWSMRQMGIEEGHVSRVNVGTGFVKCEHGMLPVPAPATLALMKGKPIYSSGVEKELLTPTGAALLTSFGVRFGGMPSMNVEKIGYGAGREDLPHPNLLRLVIGDSGSNSGQERVTVIETNIDDMNPQFYDYIMENLFTMGVLDVFVTPILMKKSRPATLLTIISSPERLPTVTQFLLNETTTLGVRWREEERSRTDREVISIQTRYGKVRFKLAAWKGKIVNLSPEYEDCKHLALKRKVPLKLLFEEIKEEGKALLRKRRRR
jgi:hypothetical protein